jgi:hypothetical protein
MNCCKITILHITFIKLAEPAGGGNKEYLNYLDYLYAKRYKNQIGIQFTRSFFDSTQFKSAIAALEYTRFEKRNTYTYRFYYAARPVGTGVQNELEWFHKINPKLYTQANIAVANQFAFPKFRISGSVFKTFKSEYELEAGFAVCITTKQYWPFERNRRHFERMERCLGKFKRIHHDRFFENVLGSYLTIAVLPQLPQRLFYDYRIAGNSSGRKNTGFSIEYFFNLRNPHGRCRVSA